MSMDLIQQHYDAELKSAAGTFYLYLYDKTTRFNLAIFAGQSKDQAVSLARTFVKAKHPTKTTEPAKEPKKLKRGSPSKVQPAPPAPSARTDSDRSIPPAQGADGEAG